MNPSKQLLIAVLQDFDKRQGEFIEFTAKFYCDERHHTSQKNPQPSSDLTEFVELLTPAELTVVWDGIFSFLSQKADSLSILSNSAANHDIHQWWSTVSDVVTAIVYLLTATLPVLPSPIPASVIESAVFLHEFMPFIAESSGQLIRNLLVICITWWTKKLEGRERLIRNSFTHILRTCLSPTAQVSDLKQLLEFSDCLSHFSPRELSDDSLYNLLVASATNALFTKTREGQKFLSSLLILNVELTAVIHKSIITSLAAAPKNIQAAYAKIYFKAWSQSNGDTREKLQTDCIQNIIYRAIHARSKTVFSPLLSILNAFHTNKVHAGMDEMLFELYEPIIWRSLKVANGDVRANAVSVLIDVFPLTNTKLGIRGNEELQQKQYDLLQTLVYDPSPVVRETTIAGTCRLLSKFWEFIPNSVIHSLLTSFLPDLINDVSSMNVRLAVVQGLYHLLSQPLCHSVVKKLLPYLSNSIHDTSEKVRLAVVELLLLVKNIRTIKFWEVVPVNSLLSRLNQDSRPICLKIVAVVRQSFLPLDKPANELLERCLLLIDSDSTAVRPFFRYAHSKMTLKEKVTYIVMLCRCILQCVRQADVENSDDMAEYQPDSNPVIDIADVNKINCLLDIMVILWATIENSLKKPENEELRNDLHRKFAIALPEYLRVYRHAGVYTTLVALASFLPHKMAPTISRGCISTLRDMNETTPASDYMILIEATFKWNKGNELLEMTMEWISAAFVEPTPQTTRKSMTRRRGVRFNVEDTPRPEFGLKYVGQMLAKPTIKDGLLRNSKDQLNKLKDILAKILPSTEQRINASSPPNLLCTDSFIEQTFSLLEQLTIITIDQDSPTSVPDIFLKTLIWSMDHVIPCLGIKRECPTMEEEKTTLLCINIIKRILNNGRILLLLELSDPEYIAQLIELINLALHSGQFSFLLMDIIKVIHQMYEWYSMTVASSKTTSELSVEVLVNLFNQTLKKFSTAILPPFSLQKSEIVLFGKSVGALINRVSHVAFDEVRAELYTSLMMAVLADLTNASQQGYLEATKRYQLQELPVFSYTILSAALCKKHSVGLVLSETCKCLSSGALKSVHALHAALHFICSIPHKMKLPERNDCLKILRESLHVLKARYHDDETKNPDVYLIEEILTRIDEKST